MYEDSHSDIIAFMAGVRRRCAGASTIISRYERRCTKLLFWNLRHNLLAPKSHMPGDRCGMTFATEGDRKILSKIQKALSRK
jgi:hypothetical protein